MAAAVAPTQTRANEACIKCPKPRLAASVAGGVTTDDTMASMIRIRPTGAVVTAMKRELVMACVGVGVVIRCLSGAERDRKSSAIYRRKLNGLIVIGQEPIKGLRADTFL